MVQKQLKFPSNEKNPSNEFHPTNGVRWMDAVHRTASETH